DIGNPLSKDSIATSGLTKIPFGYFNDPVFGTAESNVALALNLPGQGAYSLPTGSIVVDSAVLVMPYAAGFYGDSLTSKYKVNVYQLSNRIKNTTYFNTDSWGYQPGIIGTRSFFARTHDSIKIYDIITGKPDTLKKIAPELRIPINKDFVNSILFNAPSAQLASNTVFLNSVKGLYLTIDKAGTTGAGGTFMFTSSDSLNVFYRTINGTTIDTAMVTLPITTHAAQIKQTSSQTLQTEFSDTTTSKNLIYLQGMAGAKVRIKFPYLKNLTTSVGKIIVNRAELVITPNPGSTIPFGPLPKIAMYRWDIAHQIVELQDANSSDPRFISPAIFGGYFATTTNSYHFVITGYVQDLINGKTTDYGTFLAPVDVTNTRSVDINPTTQTAARLIAVGSDKNSPYRIKLNLIYTKVNK
ncbi:MAG: DUF4270 family protein, partial [Mucilaginibacter sp.]|nr:DUF4270 family protein [Mucilaginibacter sp.]